MTKTVEKTEPINQKITRAVLSVSDKTNIVQFAKGLTRHKVQILSTGGTARTLKEAGIPITEVSAYTQFPEIMDGRVKTLHPTIHGGILADRSNGKHMMSMESHNISPIDMVVVNLYPFNETVKDGGDFDKCIENIDIGGPSMIRSAAKNHKYTTVITNPDQYDAIISEMDELSGATAIETRTKLSLEAFSCTARYDSYISNWLASNLGHKHPETLINIGRLKQVLRYGENPHQSAGLYEIEQAGGGVVGATQLQGRELSYNNLNDADVAFEIVCSFEGYACSIIKHATPCAVALGASASEAFKVAFSCDENSAFGGIIALNCTADEKFAESIGDKFLEVIIAPNFTQKAKNILLSKQNLRLLETSGKMKYNDSSYTQKQLYDGILVQSVDNLTLGQKSPDALPDGWEVVTKKQPSASEIRDMVFAFQTVKFVKSNAIVFARDRQTVGIGAGQMSRVDSAHLAADKASKFLGAKNSIVASDAFFPFADGLQICIDAGVVGAVQPGGSKNDAEVIEAANKANISMVFTHSRHFKH